MVDHYTALLLKRFILAEEFANSYIQQNFRGLADFHRFMKGDLQVRSIVSNIGAPTSQLSKHLAGMLSPFVGRLQCRKFHRVCHTLDSV
jgi:ABC-type antimicrobial peptide transport system ATPase subunit